MWLGDVACVTWCSVVATGNSSMSDPGRMDICVPFGVDMGHGNG